jgi:hypothetical protein
VVLPDPEVSPEEHAARASTVVSKTLADRKRGFMGFLSVAEVSR